MKTLAMILGLSFLAATPAFAKPGGRKSERGAKRAPRTTKVKKHRRGAVAGMLRAADRNRDRAVTRREWTRFLRSLSACKRGVVSRRAPRSRIGRRSVADCRIAKRRVRTRLDFNRNGRLDVRDLRMLFSRLDRNGDRVVRRGEIEFGRRKMQPTKRARRRSR